MTWGSVSPSANACPGKDLELAGMLGSMLVKNQVAQVCQPDKQRLLAPLGMMAALHRVPLRLDGVVGLIRQGAGDGHLRVCKDGIPAHLNIFAQVSILDVCSGPV
jgi:hypothetical protein